MPISPMPPDVGCTLLVSDLVLSDEESSPDVSDLLGDRQLSVQLACSAKAQRKKIGHHTPAKLSSSDAHPLRRPTTPSLITSRKSSTAFKSSLDPSGDPEICKNFPSNS